MKSISNDEIKSKLFAYEPKEVTSISQHHMNYKQEGELTDRMSKRSSSSSAIL